MNHFHYVLEQYNYDFPYTYIHRGNKPEWELRRMDFDDAKDVISGVINSFQYGLEHDRVTFQFRRFEETFGKCSRERPCFNTANLG